MMKNTGSFLSTPVAIIIGSLLISISILLGTGILKIKGISPNTPGNNAPPVAQAPTLPPEPEEDRGPFTVSIDDDPVLGDKNAPVTIIEFSDYECPFCKRHFLQTYPELKKDYIDTGKVKLVFRDLPLTFHEPMATFEAQAANCAREQAGDSTYFKFHDEMFTKTQSNGNGLTQEAIFKIATDLGLSQANLKACVEGNKYKEEVQKDLADAQKVGATGTPTFFIGKSTNSDLIEGIKVVGAQPLTVFQKEIEVLLK